MRKKLAAVVLVCAVLFTGLGGGLVFAGDTALMTPEQARALDLPAFPGAEGGGKYTTGGRGGEVYHVTNLNDSGAGSLRDAVSQPGRTVVFDVSGTIHLKSALKMIQPGITIAGQTAPGDGICVGDYNVVIDADNVIIRYLRFRPGDISHAENDAVWARYKKDIILDHCSTSWSTDETLSLYGVANTTVQWCIASESLTLAVHAKGRHGYGGIWGGANVTYHHNLVATHTSRTPRYASKSSAHPDFAGTDGNDMVNNVIYNWGFNSSYGAEEATLNLVNNYYKPGPLTNADVRERLFNPSKGGRFFISGNVMEGSERVTADNMLGVDPAENAGEITYLKEPDYGNLIPMDAVDAAESAYERVLAGAGAILPRRDSYDARIISDVRLGAGRAINNESEAGGWPELLSGVPPEDTDGDGMPDEYERENGLEPSDPSDGRGYAANGYTNLENYLNSLAENGAEPKNPESELEIEDNSVVECGTALTLKASAKAAEARTVERVEFFDGGQKLGAVSKPPYSLSVELEEGSHYLMARTVDSAGESAMSPVKTVHVNDTGSVSPWQGVNIGETVIPGSYSYRGGAYTVKSSGLIGAGNEFNDKLGDANTDSFSFLCQPVDAYGEISAQLTGASKLNNNCKTGLMIRDGLEENSDFVLINFEYEKGGAGLSFVRRTGGDYQRDFLKLETLPRWLRLVKEGEKVRGYHSENGVDWISLGEARIPFGGAVYAGAAVDGNQETNQISNYTAGRFEHLTLNRYGENAIPDVKLVLDADRCQAGEVLHAAASSEAEDASRAELYVDGVLRENAAGLPFEFELDGLEVGSHWVTVRVFDREGACASASAAVCVSELADGWSVTDLNKAVYPGGARMGEEITLYGVGFGVEEKVEQFPYLCREVSGGFTATVKIPAQEVREYDQMGLMLRSRLEAGAPSYALYFQQYNGEYFKRSGASGEGYTQLGQQKYKKLPVWLKLERRGSLLRTFYSEDGALWKAVAEEETDLDGRCYLGLFAATDEEMLIAPFRFEEFSLTQNQGYTDLNGYGWAEEAVRTLTERGIAAGTGDGRFEPEAFVTRAEFAKLLVLAADCYDPGAVCGFTDLPAGAWYAPYAASAKQAGLVTGVSGERFEPESCITRQEMAVMLYRLLREKLTGESGTEPVFLDLDEADGWAKFGIETLGQHKILLGENGYFIPFRFVSRAEAAQAVFQALFSTK